MAPAETILRARLRIATINSDYLFQSLKMVEKYPNAIPAIDQRTLLRDFDIAEQEAIIAQANLDEYIHNQKDQQ